MAGLAFDPILRIGAFEPFLETLINGRPPEAELVTRGAPLALLDQRQIGVFLGDIVVVKGTEEKLVTLRIGERPPDIHRDHARGVRIRQVSRRIQVHISHFMTEIAVDTEIAVHAS